MHVLEIEEAPAASAAVPLQPAQPKPKGGLCPCLNGPPVTPVEPDDVAPSEVIQRLALEYAHAKAPTVKDVWSVRGIGGRSRLVCGGRLVTGPPTIDTRFSCFTQSAILIPVGFLYSVCGNFLWEEYRWIVFTSVAFFVSTVFWFLITSFTDPGIIPRPALQLLVPGLQEEVAAAIGLAGREGGRREDLLTLHLNSEIIQRLEPYGYWWCRHCSMIQPPKAKHCKDCNCCVLREDHHCPFLNNCIGQRNYGFFYGFVVSLCCLAGTFVVGAWLWMVETHCFTAFSDCYTRSRYEAVQFCIAVPLVLFVGLLLSAITIFALWHLFLIIRGQTTREFLTGRSSGFKQSVFARRGRSMIRGRDVLDIPDLADLVNR